jgi:hypothetical protein
MTLPVAVTDEAPAMVVLDLCITLAWALSDEPPIMAAAAGLGVDSGPNAGPAGI